MNLRSYHEWHLQFHGFLTGNFRFFGHTDGEKNRPTNQLSKYTPGPPKIPCHLKILPGEGPPLFGREKKTFSVSKMRFFRGFAYGFSTGKNPRKVAGPQLDVPLGTSKEQLGTRLGADVRTFGMRCWLFGEGKQRKNMGKTWKKQFFGRFGVVVCCLFSN